MNKKGTTETEGVSLTGGYWFDETVSMVAHFVDGRVYHTTHRSVDYATQILGGGHRAKVEIAERVLAAVIDCQEQDETDPHYGNFRWEREDRGVEDLNAVEFVLVRLIPLLLTHEEKLSSDVADRARDSVRNGLYEIDRIDVDLRYSNIMLQDIVNRILGGQLLNDPKTQEKGVERLKQWSAAVYENGALHEYNCPSYSSVCIEAITQLTSHATDDQTRIMAQMMRDRIALSFALHVHSTTGRLAGPHGRAYVQHLLCHADPEINVVQKWLSLGLVPNWISSALSAARFPMNILETSDRNRGAHIATYKAENYSFGVATRELDLQSNRFIGRQSNTLSLHYDVHRAHVPGVMFARYLVNDHWIGDYRTTLSRPSDQVFPNEGAFRGIADRNSAIGAFAPLDLGGWHRCSSAKVAFVWPRREDVDEVWVGQSRVTQFPIDFQPTEPIVVAGGSVLCAILPLSLTDLGRDAPARITERQGSLVIEYYNYLGPPKTFWELAQPGAFFQGNIRCAVYVEIADRNEFASPSDFAALVRDGSVVDETAAVHTQDKSNQKLWSVEYARHGAKLGMELDLLTFEATRRWTSSGDLRWPMLDSPIAKSSDSGTIQIGQATLKCGRSPAWMLADTDNNRWVAGYHGPTPAPLELVVPQGRVRCGMVSFGTVVWEDGKVWVDAWGTDTDPVVHKDSLGQ